MYDRSDLLRVQAVRAAVDVADGEVDSARGSDYVHSMKAVRLLKMLKRTESYLMTILSLFAV